VTTEPFISYAQNREDVVLRRALVGVSEGRYIDVGANDPTIDSVTRAFYDAGWHGITAEPVPAFADAQRAQRPRDLLFQAAVTDTDGGEVVLHEFPDTGLSTVVDEFAERHVAAGREATELTVPTRTLDSLLDEAGWQNQPIHFLLIDVEGAEGSVLRGVDLGRWRPWIIVAEATEPTSATPTYQEWEELLTRRGYRFAQFDGLSRFYVADEQWDELHDAVERPAGPLDDFISFRTHELVRDLEQVSAERGRLAAAIDVAAAERERLEAELANCRAELAGCRAELEEAQEQQAAARDAAVAWRSRAVGAWAARAADGNVVAGAELDQLRRQVDAVNGELAAMRATVSWRVTGPLRTVRRGTQVVGR
jgi:FkbM family methyltransferase